MLKKPIFTLIFTFFWVLFPFLPVFAGSGLNGRFIILDPGHGIESDNTYLYYSEQATMLHLALTLKPLLESEGATVFLTRPDIHNVSLPVRAAKMNLWSLEFLKNYLYQDIYSLLSTDRIEGINGRPQPPGEILDLLSEVYYLSEIMENIIYNYRYFAPLYFNFPFDFNFEREISTYLERIFELQTHPQVRDRFLVISLHSNATPRPINHSVNGADVYYMSNFHRPSNNYFANYANEGRSRYFGNLILDNIDNLGITRRHLRPGNWFVIREHNLTGVLVENGFHTNPYDREKLSDNDFLDELALAYVDAILKYFDEIYLTSSFEGKPPIRPLQTFFMRLFPPNISSLIF